MRIDMAQLGWLKRPAMASLLILWGCTVAGDGASGQPSKAVLDADERPGNQMHLYEPDPSDPQWLVKASEFHGHLGPWSTVGAMIGRDAVQRLGQPLPWNVKVVCCMPTAARTPPFSCMIDGLQSGSGATMGKRNISFAWQESRPPQDWPEIFVARTAADGTITAGLSYHLTPQLRVMVDGATMNDLEALSRRIAAMNPNGLFIRRSLTGEELRMLGGLTTNPTE